MNISNYINVVNTIFMQPHLSNFLKQNLKLIFTEKEITLLFKTNDDSGIIEPSHTYYLGAYENDEIILLM